MQQNLEIETKVMISKTTYHHISSTCEFEQTFSQYNHYYKAMVQPEGSSLRIRKIKDQFLFTMKVNEGDYKREYEEYLDQDDINDPKLKPLFDQFHVKGPFTVLGQSHTLRSVLTIKAGTIYVDHTYFDWGDDFEIEFEAKDTNEETTNEFYKWLRFHHVAYTKSNASKMKRALNKPKEK